MLCFGNFYVYLKYWGLSALHLGYFLMLMLIAEDGSRYLLFWLLYLYLCTCILVVISMYLYLCICLSEPCCAYTLQRASWLLPITDHNLDQLDEVRGRNFIINIFFIKHSLKLCFKNDLCGDSDIAICGAAMTFAPSSVGPLASLEVFSSGPNQGNSESFFHRTRFQCWYVLRSLCEC